MIWFFVLTPASWLLSWRVKALNGACIYHPPLQGLLKMLGSSFSGGWQYLQRSLSWADEDFLKINTKKSSYGSLGQLENHGVDLKVFCHLNLLIMNFKGDCGKAMIIDRGR